MRSAVIATKSCSARMRSVVAGISRISRAMAVCSWSSRIMRQLVDNGSQIALVFEQGGNLDVTLRALNKFSGIILVASYDLADDDGRAAQKLRVARAHAHHQTPVDAAQSDHDGGRKQIEYNLLCRTRLHPCRSCQHFGAGLDQNTVARQFEKRRTPVVGHGDAEGPPCSGGAKRSDRERRRTARRNSDNNIVLINFSLGDPFRPFFPVVFGPFDALKDCLHSSSHYENDALAWPIVGRTKLCPVLNGDTSGGPGTYVNQPTTVPEGRRGIIYRGIYRRQGRPDGRTRDELPVIHGRNHVVRGPGIQVDKPRIYLLGQHIGTCSRKMT